MQLESKRLLLVLSSPADLHAQLEAMDPADRAELSPAWLALLEANPEPTPWIHGFDLLDRESGESVGSCGFKGPPDDAGMVEIAYGIAPAHRNQGLATEATAAATAFALADPQVQTVRAHTLPEENASTRVLTKCGFRKLGEVLDPEDGPVWRWERVEL